MSQYEFDKLVTKYLAGECSPEEEKQMCIWADSLLDQSQLNLSPAEKQVIDKRLWSRIYTHTLGQQPFRLRYGWPVLSAVAAAVLLLLLAGVYAWQRPGLLPSTQAVAQRVSQPEDTVQIQNRTTRPRKIILKDGSLVLLAPHSQLSYSKIFGSKNRQVYLQGAATFDVRRDPARPFTVHTGNLVTQVLGTSFTVTSSADAIEVLVTHGRVSVYEDVAEKSAAGRNGVILSPNQKITFDKASQKLTPGLVDVPRMVQPPEHKTRFVFDRTPLGQVLNLIRKTYGIDIIVENHAITNCIFTGDLNDLSLYEQLDLICKSLNASYERRGTTLFVQGEGCAD